MLLTMTPPIYIRAAMLSAVAAIVFRTDLHTPVRAQSTDPCATASSAVDPSARGTSQRAPENPAKTSPLDHDDRWSHLDSVWNHRAAVAQGRLSMKTADTRLTEDVGEIAVLQDRGDLVMAPNPFDLRNVGLRLTPNDSGGYDVSRIAYEFRRTLGTGLTMDDDDARRVALPFTFSFFGQPHDHVFVNSDGNLTFGEGDVATSARSVSRLLTGAPRVAPLFADLNPSAGGQIWSFADDRALTVTWCNVREYGTRETATVQVTLHQTGPIDIQFSNRTTIREAVVGVSPGNTTQFLPVDFTAQESIAGGSSALGERFTSQSDLDTVAVARRFLATHRDAFDNIVIFTDQKLLTNAFAYEISVANQIQGLNLPVFDYSAEYGSAGPLQSLCNMDALSKYPDEPREVFLGENSTLSVMGQEIGHRWLAFLYFRDHMGRVSRALLGRDAAHWSFFFDSDASVLEGNDIEDLGSGSFRTVAAVQHYSLLDQYAMGLVDQTQVPPFFYVQSPSNLSEPRTAASEPEVGVTFSGIRRDVRIEDVIAVVGPRVPSAADSPRVYRQAFVYVVSNGRTGERSAIEKLDRIRVAWDQFLSAATDSRMKAETRLAEPVESSVDRP
jgi:hypothetical protein